MIRYDTIHYIYVRPKADKASLICHMDWGGSGISSTICNLFAPLSRQITMPVPHHSVFTGRMTLLPPNQEHQSTEGNHVTSGSKTYC